MAHVLVKENINVLADGIEKLNEQIVEINSKLDAREQEILDLYSRLDSVEYGPFGLGRRK